MRTTHSRNLALFGQISAVILFLLLTETSAQSECGDFYDIGRTTMGNIYSPDYPKPYPPNSFCIWLIAAPVYYRIQLLLNFVGERYNGVCSDYVEIREGSKYAPLIGMYCDNVTDVMLRSSAQWLWIKFRSDRINGTGTPMHAVFYAVYNSTPPQNATVPFGECRSYEFVCRNKECLSMSYRCDGLNDCGCLKNCDESLCYGLDISKSTQIAISLSIGFTVFGVLCLITYCIEGKNNWIASQAEALREKEIMAERQRQRASRAFSKFIGSEKELLSSVPKSRMNLAGTRFNRVSSFWVTSTKSVSCAWVTELSSPTQRLHLNTDLSHCAYKNRCDFI